MKQRLLSPYKNHQEATPGKAFLGALCDYAIVFILTMLLFMSVGLPVFSALPSVNNNKDIVSKETTALKETVAETGLQPIDPVSGSSISLNDLAKNYIATLAKTSYYLYDEPYPIDNVHAEAVKEEDTFFASDYKNDPISYYYYVYKSSHESLNNYIYDSVDYRSDKAEYLYKIAFGYKNDEYASFFHQLSEDLHLYQQLSLLKAKNVAAYLVYADNGGLDTYISLQKAYLSASNVFINEVETRYEPYLEHKASFLKAYEEYSFGYVLSPIAAYVFSFILLELFPLISKRDSTFGYHFTKLAYIDNEEGTIPRLHQYLKKSALRFFSFLSIPFVLLFFFSQGGLLFVSYFGYFRFVYLLLVSLLLSILSIIVTFVSSSHVPLEEKWGGISIVDTTQIESGVPLEERKESDGRE